MLGLHRLSQEAEASAELLMDDFQCMLEVLQALSVSPSVTDAAVPQEGVIRVSTDACAQLDARQTDPSIC